MRRGPPWFRCGDCQIFAQQDRWEDAFELAGTIAERFPEFRQQHEVDYLMGRCLSHQARFREARGSLLVRCGQFPRRSVAPRPPRWCNG